MTTGSTSRPNPSAIDFYLNPEALGPRLLATYDELRAIYGPQGWWPAKHSFEMCAGAILVQNTAWANARRALDNLERYGADSVLGVVALSEAELADLVRPSGYYNQKAAKLAIFCEHVVEAYGADLESFLSLPLDRLRTELLGLWGIGEETADSIILYAAKKPSFVMDTYTARLLERTGIVPSGTGKAELRAAVMAAVPEDVKLYAEFHALIVQHGKHRCGSTPQCGECSLIASCTFGQSTGIVGVRPARAAAAGRDYWAEP